MTSSINNENIIVTSWFSFKAEKGQKSIIFLNLINRTFFFPTAKPPFYERGIKRRLPVWISPLFLDLLSAQTLNLALISWQSDIKVLQRIRDVVYKRRNLPFNWESVIVSITSFCIWLDSGFSVLFHSGYKRIWRGCFNSRWHSNIDILTSVVVNVERIKVKIKSGGQVTDIKVLKNQRLISGWIIFIDYKGSFSP